VIYTLSWTDLKVVGKFGLLTIPLYDLYAPVLKASFPKVFRGPWLPGPKSTGRTFLTLSSGDAESVQELLDFFKTYPLIARSKVLDARFTNQLDESYCLDRNLISHDSREHTAIGQLEFQAKYRADHDAARKLGTLIATAVKLHPTLRDVDAICAVPGSPGKTGGHLPDVIAARVATKLDKPIVEVVKTMDTGRVTDMAIGDKAQALDGAFSVKSDVEGLAVLVVDDKVQSGSTMWTLAAELKSDGARRVSGFAAVKTWRDSDNVQ
jgi:predicted amidophosphoribosyltransferase